EQIADEPREVGSRAARSSLREPFARLRLDRDEDAARPSTAILVVLLSDLARRRRRGRPRVLDHLVGLLIKADDRFVGVERLLVLPERPLHPLAELVVQLGNAPRFFRHGFRSCSRSQSEISDTLSDSTKPCFNACSHSSS